MSEKEIKNDEKTDSQKLTEREVERNEEDKDFTPVILKRTDESLRHPDDILENAILEGLEQLKRPTLSLFLSSLAAGLILGFTAMSVAVVETHSLGMSQSYFARMATALVYPLGFVLCIMSGTQLFTEHTATAVYPVLDRRGSIMALFRLWLIVILGNLGGSFVSSGLLVSVDEVVHARAGYIEIGQHLVNFSSGSLFVSAVLAGWLMALGAWLVMATQPTLSQIISIYIVTFIIGLGDLHHSIAGSVEIFTAYLISDQFLFSQVSEFIGIALFGNMIGGSIFVALLNYGHIRKTQRKNGD
ncbi:MAG: formate transporter [Desulfuromonas sp.]|nr:MAG: formate transporter [Desulfuromonas sp.]